MIENDPIRHAAYEDVHAFVIGTVLVCIGLECLRSAGLITGGTAGLAFLIHYISGFDLGLVFFVINLPFYGLAFWAMGWVFSLKTFLAVALLSIETTTLPWMFGISHIDPLYAALAGGILIGMGLLALIRHQGSLGGVNILCLVLQKKLGINAGKVQMAIDCAIVTAALFKLDLTHVALSIFGAISLNLVIALNHRPGRYNGF